MSIQRFLTAAAVSIAVCLPATAFGASIVNLYDHPNGTETGDPPNYGLRLDGLDGDAGTELSSFFSFENAVNADNIAANSLAILAWDFGLDEAVMLGQMRRNSDNSLWDLSVRMFGLDELTDGWSADIFYGTLKAVSGGEVIELYSKDDDDGNAFTFATQDTVPGDYLDFRGGITTAAGWISGFRGTNDFLATAGGEFGGELPDIPLPAGVFLLMGGLGALGATRLKRKRG